ncbi:MAG: aspartate kinase [Planctomycetota bacterium]
MSVKVSKFGGSSLADAARMRRAAAIVLADADRRYVVPSAPGKRSGEDRKVTDLLYTCHDLAKQGLSFAEPWGLVAERFRGIADELGLDVPIESWLGEARDGIEATSGNGPDFAASRGEAINGRVLAALLGWGCVDASEVVWFGPRGRLDEARTYRELGDRLRELGRAVVPGFYGRMSGPDGAGAVGGPAGVKTFSRGGSDVTGAIVARSVGASVYENWTDVPGLLITDPRVVPGAYPIEVVTYRELRELSYSGARVLHEDAVFPVRSAGIPVRILSTLEPEAPGTWIVAAADPKAEPVYEITGIAGRSGFTAFTIEKAMMNAEVGLGMRALTVLDRYEISFEHMPSGVDTMTLVIDDAYFDGASAAIAREALVAELMSAVDADEVAFDPSISLIATVGRGMKRKPGMAAKLFGALAEAGVNIRMIDQGSSELNITVGVDDVDYAAAVRSIYAAFVGGVEPTSDG